MIVMWPYLLNLHVFINIKNDGILVLVKQTCVQYSKKVPHNTKVNTSACEVQYHMYTYYPILQVL